MIMYFKWWKSQQYECGLVKEQCVHSLLDLLLLFSTTLTPISYSYPPSFPQNKQEVGKAAVRLSWNYPSILQILALGHQPRCPKLFLSTDIDINYLDLWGQNAAIMVGSVWMRKGFWCIFKMSNEHTEYLQVEKHILLTKTNDPFMCALLNRLWEKKVAKCFRTGF